jgi:hypothetical protein
MASEAYCKLYTFVASYANYTLVQILTAMTTIVVWVAQHETVVTLVRLAQYLTWANSVSQTRVNWRSQLTCSTRTAAVSVGLELLT